MAKNKAIYFRIKLSLEDLSLLFEKGIKGEQIEVYLNELVKVALKGDSEVEKLRQEIASLKAEIQKLQKENQELKDENKVLSSWLGGEKAHKEKKVEKT